MEMKPDTPLISEKADMQHSWPSELADQYLIALGTYFDQGLQANLQPARELGAAAAATGLETLDLAMIHERALADLLSPDATPAGREDLIRRGATFFTEAVVPIEATHTGTPGGGTVLERLNATLDKRTLDLADTLRELQQQITERREAETALQTSELTSGQLLKESRVLETQLQDMVRGIISATEDERRIMSLHLNDSIAQTLLGINIRLMALKKMIAINDENLSIEIATIQQLLADSGEIINRLTHEFNRQ